MAGLQVTVTPPNPPPKHEEEAPSSQLEVIIKQRLGAYVVKTVCWLAATAEIAAIVASTFPDASSSTVVLRGLVVSGSATDIQISWLFIVGVSLTMIGGYIRYSCYRELGSLFTFEMAILDNHRLVQSGPYAYVRHPGYLGVLCTVSGVICWHASSGSYARACGAFESRIWQVLMLIYCMLVSTITVGLLSRMPKEDDALRKRFPGEWEDWQLQVPYKLLPFVY
ncbi:hypothetical protein CYLTODRAFT_416140 [Cylindrobasidium torrendii FP15055 ss-10]|uniref:Protein-S-isoprenylcysteine O-methyltransferase n=1 Tax=Cylindrobasidium torrendii FP15055 ss-10 TaxID=1314674 RepID=A0A0D7BVM8_9AGAR|nr:hypothetical protein CYLTODRAFT_416140 [Cylindrobasidium torrendii FP15055 ss-10]